MTAVAKLPTVDELAQEIRRVDGNHSLGAGALAEALMPFLAALSPAELGGVEGDNPADYLFWTEGVPHRVLSRSESEWFIAETVNGDRVVLRALPEEWTYDYTTADGTYMKAASVKRWMQFPDGQFKPLGTTPRAAEAVTDEMVGRALSSYYRNWSTWKQAVELGGDLSGAMRAALTAALNGSGS